MIALGVSEFPDLTITTVRNWTPMDGAGEPYCPYQDIETHAGANECIAIDASCTMAHWNDNEVASASVRLSLALPSGLTRGSAPTAALPTACRRRSPHCSKQRQS
ncbi:MAG: hypothetical protein JWM34_2786 [Ilumatobacteraceae bacterium]|nr:hypothetical protein [Ilumatobacteraceae bacterium]